MAVYKATFSVDRNFARVAEPTVARIAQDPCLEHIRKLPSCEVEALIYCILRHFARWSGGDVPQLESCVALIKNICFIRSVPRFEASCLLYTIRDMAAEIDRTERLRAGADVDRESAEAESRFFDLVVFELLNGY